MECRWAYVQISPPFDTIIPIYSIVNNRLNIVIVTLENNVSDNKAIPQVQSVAVGQHQVWLSWLDWERLS